MDLQKLFKKEKKYIANKTYPVEGDDWEVDSHENAATPQEPEGGKLIVPANIVPVFCDIVKYINRYIDRYNEYGRVENVLRDIALGKLKLLICASEGIVNGIVVYSVQDIESSTEKEAICEIVSGDFGQEVFEYLEKYDWKADGIVKLHFEGRGGWLKVARKKGWKLKRIEMTKDL